MQKKKAESLRLYFFHIYKKAIFAGDYTII